MEDSHRLGSDVELHGVTFGEIIVPSGIKLVLHGVARSDVIVEKGGCAIIRGTVAGCLINLGGSVEVFGTVSVIANAPGTSTLVGPGALILSPSASGLKFEMNGMIDRPALKHGVAHFVGDRGISPSYARVGAITAMWAGILVVALVALGAMFFFARERVEIAAEKTSSAGIGISSNPTRPGSGSN